jgi:Domain of unknown function (DUF4345)
MTAGESLLRIVLVLGGGFILLTGVDVGLGGITTLGLMGTNDFIAVTDPHAFSVHDSHVRFLGGLWIGIGFAFLGGAIWLQGLRPALYLAYAAIFIGGVARLSSQPQDVLFTSEVAGSLAAELIGMPLLFAWTWFARKKAN